MADQRTVPQTLRLVNVAEITFRQSECARP